MRVNSTTTNLTSFSNSKQTPQHHVALRLRASAKTISYDTEIHGDCTEIHREEFAQWGSTQQQTTQQQTPLLPFRPAITISYDAEIHGDGTEINREYCAY